MNKRYVRKSSLCVVFIVFAFVTAVVVAQLEGAESQASEPARTDNSVAVTLSPVHTYVSIAETCTLSVLVESPGDSLGCIECWVSFDTTLVEILDAEEGRLFEQAPFPRLFFWMTIAPDTHSVEGCLLGYDTYTVTPGEVARYVFRALRDGTCPVKITRLKLFDIDRVIYEPIVDPNAWILIGPATGLKPEPPAEGGLSGYPNPFNPSTSLVFTSPSFSTGKGFCEVSIGIFASDGRLVRELYEGATGPEGIRVTWDGKNHSGVDAASGVYFAAARTADKTYRTKLVLIR